MAPLLQLERLPVPAVPTGRSSVLWSAVRGGEEQKYEH